MALEPEMVESEMTASARQRPCNHVSSATNIDTLQQVRCLGSKTISTFRNKGFMTINCDGHKTQKS